MIGAENATLTFMVGGTGEDYDTVKAVLECMGQRITHCGGYGMGQAAKLCNNMLLGISMIGVCETMNLAVRLGLDAQVFSDIINSSTGRCWSSEIYNPVPGICANAPANKNYAGGFSTALITKVSFWRLIFSKLLAEKWGRALLNYLVFFFRIWDWRPTLRLHQTPQFHWGPQLIKFIVRCNPKD